jgi:hypothetical protein
MIVMLNLVQHLGLSLGRDPEIVDPELNSGHSSG